MLSANKLQPFIEGDAQIVARAAADGTIVGFDTEVESEEVSSIMSDVQDEYDEFIENLGDILYTNSGVDRAYQFGRLLRSGVEDRAITEDQFLQMVDFDEVNTDEARLFVKFSELYPDGSYPDGTNPKVAGALADEHSAQKAREINKVVIESDHQLTDEISDLWYETSEYTVSTVCQRVGESDVKRPLDAVSLIYLLGGETPPSEVKIKSHLPEPDAVVDSCDSDSDTLTMTTVSEEETAVDENKTKESGDSGVSSASGNEPPLEKFKTRFEAVREKYDDSRLDYEIGSLVRVFNEKHGIPVSAMAETDVVDFSYSYLNNYKHVAGPFTKDSFPSDISVNDLYRLITEYDDDATARNRILGATSFDSTRIHTEAIDYFKSTEEVEIESAVEEISGSSTEETVTSVQIVHILDGKTPPEEIEVYEALGETPPDDVSEGDKSSEEYQLDRGIPPAPEDTSNETQPQTTEDSIFSPSIEDEDDMSSHKPKLRDEIAPSFIDSEYAKTLFDHSDVTYQPETKTLVPSSPEVKQQITAEYGEFIPTESVVDAFTNPFTADRGKTYLVATNDMSVHETLKSGENRFEIGETIDPQATDGSLYNGVKSHTHLPLIISYPDNSEHVALAIETYANNGGESVVYIGEMSNNGETPEEVIQALHDNYTIERIETGVQWTNSSDALYVFTKHTNTEDIQ